MVFTPLLMWSAVWMALAIWRLRSVTSGGFSDGFWLMNGFWAALNVAIVAYGLALPTPSTEAFVETLRWNAWMDLGYAATGVVLVCRPRAFLRGFGVAILIQAAFLGALDLGAAAYLNGS